MKKCSKINSCQKISMVLDKDLACDEQYRYAIKALCDKCTGGNYEETVGLD